MKNSFTSEKTLSEILSGIKTLSSRPAESKHPISNEEFEVATHFIIRLVLMAYSYGVSTTRLEAYLIQLLNNLGIEGEFSFAPPHVNFVFKRPQESQQQYLFIRLPAVSYNLTKLSLLGSLLNQFEQGKITVTEVASRLDACETLPTPYKTSVVALGYALCGAGIAVLLAATWRDVFFSAMLSLVVFMVTLSAGHSEWLSSRLNLTAALTASLLANGIAILFPGSNAFTVTLCAVIVLIPGLSLTLGVAELAGKNILSGVNRLLDGIIITLALFIGSVVGTSIIEAIWSVPPPASVIQPAIGLIWIFVVLLMIGLCFIFQVRHQDIFWVIVAGSLAYACVLLGQSFGDWQGSFLGALALGVYTSFFTLKLKRPGSVVMLPGIMILVPGIAAYFGVSTLQTSGIFGVLPAVWGVFVQIAAIIAGLYVAASIVPQKATL
ncbi:threonine/serine exporter family protein [Chloroflexota bacterium]